MDANMYSYIRWVKEKEVEKRTYENKFSDPSSSLPTMA